MQIPKVTPKEEIRMGASIEFMNYKTSDYDYSLIKIQALTPYPAITGRYGLSDRVDIGFQTLWISSIGMDVGYQLTNGKIPSLISVGLGANLRSMKTNLNYYNENDTNSNTNSGYTPYLSLIYSIGFHDFYANTRFVFESKSDVRSQEVNGYGINSSFATLYPGFSLGYSPERFKFFRPLIEINFMYFDSKLLVLPNIGLTYIW